MSERTRGLVQVSERQRLLEAALDDLASRSGVLAAAIVRRDGIAVLQRGSAPVPAESFAAMTAVALGAIDVALGATGAPVVLDAVSGSFRFRAVPVEAAFL